MFIPLSDSPNYSDKRPWVNYGLLALNVFAYFVLTPLGDEAQRQAFLWEWGFIPGAPHLETYFTSMFLHGGFMHLAGNMLFLWIFGDNVEGRLGHVGYLFAYLTFGLAAVLLYQVIDPASMIPLVGASGAIFGVLGFYFLAFKDNRVRVLIWFFYVFWPEMNARLVLGAYFVIDFVNMVIAKNAHAAAEGQGGVAYAAHVGGFAFGLLLAFAVLRFLPPLPMAGVTRRRSHGLARRGRSLGLRAPQQMHAAAVARMRRAVDAARAGRYEDAYADFEWIVRVEPDTPLAGEAALHMAMIRGRVVGDFAGARGLLQYAIRNLDDPALRQRAEAEFAEIT